MFDFTDTRYTHMPFVAADADSRPKPFCCIMNNGLWKLYHHTGSSWKRVKTGLPPDATECGPAAEFEDGMWKLSFIAGGWEGDRRFRLYRMYGLDSEPMIQGFADVGFVRKNTVAHASRRGPIILVEPERVITLTMPRVAYLYRLSYDPQQPNRLLVSGELKEEGGVFSWAYKPGLRELTSLTADGVAAYKCAFWQGDCFYAQRHEGFEDRRIAKADTLEATRLPAGDFIQETEEHNGASLARGEFE